MARTYKGRILERTINQLKIDTMKNIRSFLPVFNGFYESHFSDIVDTQLNCILSEDDELEFDSTIFDYSKLQNDIARACVGQMQSTMFANGVGAIIKFEELVSPREYNFTTDEIKCTYFLTDNSLNGLLALVADNSEAFEVYVRELFDSREGFASFNNGIKAEDVLKRHEEFFGYILQFLCNEVWEYTDEEMADRVSGNVSLDYEVKTN